jgi:hypothetical protein
MKKSSLAIACLLILGVIGIRTHGQGTAGKSHEEWLQDEYKQASSIKAGMTRTDLQKIFSIDGGINSIPASRYVLKSCRMIKVEVEFEPTNGRTFKETSNQELKIIKISKPYLEPMFSD